MGIFDALTTAVAGLQAQSFALQNISGNIANSQTTGYKETNTAFQDLVSQASVGLQTPDGVTSRSVATNTVQGSITSTQVSTDMAINGNGFFVVAKPTGFVDNAPTFSGINDYTRAGDFTMNNNGNLVNSAGYYLMGIPVDGTTGNPLGSVPEVLQFSNNFIPAVATTSITYQANLPATPKSGVINPANFEANPIAGAPANAEILGSGAKLNADAPATGTGTVGSLTATTTLSSLGILTGDTISVSDGTNTTTYTVPAGPPAPTINDLITAINGGTAAATASLSNGNLVIKGTNDVDTISVSSTSTTNGAGADAADLGFGSGNTSFKPVNLITQSAVSSGQTLTITVPIGGTNTQVITFGTGVGQVATLSQLQTALNAAATASGNLYTATVDATGNITITATSSSNSIQVGGNVSTSKFGLTNLSALPANGTVIANDVSTFDSESVDGGSITAYDSVGNPVNVQLRWAQVSSASSGSTWQLFYQSNSAATGTQSAWTNVGTTFAFNSNGEMSPQITSLTIPGLTVNGDNLGNVQLQIGTDGLTQFASPSGSVQVNTLQQNGYAAGSLQSVSVDSQNRIVGNFTNGKTIPLAEVTLATFNGADALQALNGGAFAATPESGPPNYSAATGSIEGSSLEASNVDIATQFSQLIVAQQAYSANARVMTTSNQMIQSLLTVIQ